MVIEQAFFNLPEIMVGSGYANQEYEAGIVSAFSLAVLQELNGRNINNPISLLNAERKYARSGGAIELNNKLRADLHVNLSKLNTGSQELSDFGFRFSNWIEAKYFRVNKGTPPSTQNLGAVVADLIRLVALVPLEPAKRRTGEGDTDQIITGRYFLHVYRGDPYKHLNPNRKARSKEPRRWVEPLLSPGKKCILDFELDNDTGRTFTKHLGTGFDKLKLSICITNFHIQPSVAIDNSHFTFILTRIESANIRFNNYKFILGPDRKYEISGKGSFDDFRREIANRLKPKKETEAIVDPQPEEE